jgi:hypothetical protein
MEHTVVAYESNPFRVAIVSVFTVERESQR